MRNSTLLGSIMGILDISGKELAYELGIDTTTVSKWRTQKRKISYQSEYSQAMAELFLSSKYSAKRKHLLDFLEKICEGFSQLAGNEQIEILRQLLCGTDNYVLISKNQENVQEYSADIQVFAPTAEGWELAMKYFESQVSSQKEPSKLMLCDFGNIDWNCASKEIIKPHVNRLKAMSEAGHDIIIIDMVGENYRSPDILFRWFSIYMSRGIELYYVRDTLPLLERGCCYAIENGGALVGFFEGHISDAAYVFFNDKRMKHHFWNKADYFFQNAKKMIERIDINDNLSMVSLLDSNLSVAEITYMMNPSPTYINMSEGLLRSILERNQVDDEAINISVEVIQKRHAIRKRCKYIQIYDIDEIEERLSLPENKMNLLSIVVGKEIKMSRKEYVQQLEEISGFIQKGEMEIYLVSFKKVGISRKTVSITVQENRLFIAWDDVHYDTMMYSTEPTFIGGMVLYIKNILDKIHPLYKNKDWTIEQFKKYITQYKE